MLVTMATLATSCKKDNDKYEDKLEGTWCHIYSEEDEDEWESDAIEYELTDNNKTLILYSGAIEVWEKR